MKKIILNLLKNGYVKTKKYTVEDIIKYLYIFRGLIYFDAEAEMIRCNSNPFWSGDNVEKRIDLFRDIMSMKRKDIKDSYYFRILNRFENGDKYGIIFTDECLIENLKSLVAEKGAELEINDNIEAERQIHYWYGGTIVTILYKGYKFELAAIGDVYAHLLDDDMETEIARVKDKGNSAIFWHVCRPYIKNDKELRKFIAEGRLTFDYNNWWECSIVSPDGEWHDLMWALDSDTIECAVSEVLVNMDEYIAYLESK